MTIHSTIDDGKYRGTIYRTLAVHAATEFIHGRYHGLVVSVIYPRRWYHGQYHGLVVSVVVSVRSGIVPIYTSYLFYI